MKNKKIDAKIIAKHQKEIDKRNKGIASATEVREQTLEEAKTSFKKLLRPNFYKDEKAKANVTQTAKIADDAHSKAEVTEDCKKLVRPNPYKDEKAKANVTLTAKIADAAHSKAKVTEERDADENQGNCQPRGQRQDLAEGASRRTRHVLGADDRPSHLLQPKDLCFKMGPFDAKFPEVIRCPVDELFYRPGFHCLGIIS